MKVRRYPDLRTLNWSWTSFGRSVHEDLRVSDKIQKDLRVSDSRRLMPSFRTKSHRGSKVCRRWLRIQPPLVGALRLSGEAHIAWSAGVEGPRDRLSSGGNRIGPVNVLSGMDAEDREVLVDEGLDPDDPRVVAAIDLVRWELSMFLDDG